MSGNDISIHHVKDIRMKDKRTSTLDDGREFTSQKVVIEYLDLVDTGPIEHGWVTCTTEITLFMSDGEEKNIAELLG
tara:strand:- start:1039 stop:1269 length:231 start_codon:yes stop_codon:yes gene_type:complete